MYGEPDHLYWRRGKKDTENTLAIDTVFIKEDRLRLNILYTHNVLVSFATKQKIY